MFNYLAGEAAGLLEGLETRLPMLSDRDQNYVNSCRMQLELGTALTPPQLAELKRIANTVEQNTHATLGGAISVHKMLKDLVGQMSVLSYEEKRFLARLAQKVQVGTPVATHEVEHLVGIYTSKGF